MLSCSMTTHNYFPLILWLGVKHDSLYSSYNALNENMSGRTHCCICTPFCNIVLVILPDMFCCLAHHHELSNVFASLRMLCVYACVLMAENAKAIHPKVFIKKDNYFYLSRWTPCINLDFYSYKMLNVYKP